MLTEAQHDIIRATVPVLRVHGESISRVFYASLLGTHPELYDIFNPVNQANGRQQRSLAGSVLAYAANIDRLDALGGMVERITHKHGVLEVQEASGLSEADGGAGERGEGAAAGADAVAPDTGGPAKLRWIGISDRPLFQEAWI